MIKKITTTRATITDFMAESVAKINEIIVIVNDIETKTKKMNPGTAYDLSAIDLKMRGKYK